MGVTTGEIIDWAFRVLFAGLAVYWGRSQKLADDLVEAKAEGLKRLVAHDCQALEQLVASKAADSDRRVSEKARAIDRLFESELGARDQRIGACEKRMDEANARADAAVSSVASQVGKIEHRLTVLETRSAR